MAEHALDVAGNDARSRPLLLQLLESEDIPLVAQAIDTLGAQRDFTALPAIERALQRLPDDHLALMLSSFADERADEIARKYLSEDEIETYDGFRAQSARDRER
jgi:hypothetical protein